MTSYKEIMNDITTFVFDVDGVLTDGSVNISPTGEMLRKMNIRDGYAMKAVPHASGVFAVALESSDDESPKTIEALVL